jgi:hypothetical protein
LGGGRQRRQVTPHCQNSPASWQAEDSARRNKRKSSTGPKAIVVTCQTYSGKQPKTRPHAFPPGKERAGSKHPKENPTQARIEVGNDDAPNQLLLASRRNASLPQCPTLPCLGRMCLRRMPCVPLPVGADGVGIWNPERPLSWAYDRSLESLLLPIRQNLLGWIRADRQNREIPNRRTGRSTPRCTSIMASALVLERAIFEKMFAAARSWRLRPALQRKKGQDLWVSRIPCVWVTGKVLSPFSLPLRSLTPDRRARPRPAPRR